MRILQLRPRDEKFRRFLETDDEIRKQKQRQESKAPELRVVTSQKLHGSTS